MALFDRRTLITGALAAASVPGVALAGSVPPSNALRFNIVRNGKPFGQYNVLFAMRGDALTVTSDVTMSMRISGLTVFDYMLHCEEVWRGGKFIELRSRSRRDKDSQAVTAVRTDVGINVTNQHGLVTLPLTANPLSHWNAAALQGPLFNPQDGYPLRLVAQPVGHDPVTLANGSKLAANRWALRGQSEIDDWYDDAGVWAGLRAVFPDKSLVEYRRV